MVLIRNHVVLRLDHSQKVAYFLADVLYPLNSFNRRNMPRFFSILEKILFLFQKNLCFVLIIVRHRWVRVLILRLLPLFLGDHDAVVKLYFITSIVFSPNFCRQRDNLEIFVGERAELSTQIRSWDQEVFKVLKNLRNIVRFVLCLQVNSNAFT